MKARTLKKKVSTKQAKKNWSHSQNNRNVLSFFFPFFFIASRRKAARMDSVERKKKRTLCANNYASTNSNKKQPSLVAAEKRLCFKNTRTTSTRKPFYCTALPRNKFEGASKTDRGNKCRL